LSDCGGQEDYLGGREAEEMGIEQPPVPADEAERVIAASEVRVGFPFDSSLAHS
jgi:hypothetical protein